MFCPPLHHCRKASERDWLGLGSGNFKGVGSSGELGEGGENMGFEEVGEGGAWVTMDDG